MSTQIMAPQVSFDEIATLKQAAEYLKMDPKTVSKHCVSGRIKAMNFPTNGRNNFRIRWSELRGAKEGL